MQLVLETLNLRYKFKLPVHYRCACFWKDVRNDECSDAGINLHVNVQYGNLFFLSILLRGRLTHKSHVINPFSIPRLPGVLLPVVSFFKADTSQFLVHLFLICYASLQACSNHICPIKLFLFLTSIMPS